MTIFEGAGVALVTPFNNDLSVNYAKLEELVDYHAANGTDSLIICGTTGEASTLTEDEHIECIRVAAARAKKASRKLPVIAGTGSNDTATAVYLSKEAKKAGADATLVVTPYYNKATQKGLYEHFKLIATESELPMILYNVPSRTGCNIMPATAAKLFRDIDLIAGIKEASGNISQVAQVVDETNGELAVYSGNDDQIVPVLSLGGVGVISVLSNILPQETHDIVATYLAGDVKTSRELQIKYLKLVDALFSEVNPIPVKAAMNLAGFNCGSLRRPLTDMESAHLEVLKAEMAKFNLVK